MTNFTKDFKKLYAGKGTANGGLMLALEPQFLKLDEIDEIPIDTDFELEWTCSSKVGLVDVEIYLLNHLVNSYTDIDAQDKSATIKVEEGDAVMVGGTLRIVIKDKLGILEDEIEIEVVEGGVPDGQFIYVGHANNADTYVSIDSGNSFSSLNRGAVTSSIAVPAHGEYAYFGTYTQLSKATYDGVWTGLKDLAGKSFNVTACSDSGQYIITGAQEGGVYYSTDYGETIQTLTGGTTSAKKVFMSPDGKNQVVIICGDGYGGGRPFFSADYGATWNSRDTENRVWFGIAGTTDGTKIYGVAGQSTNSYFYTFTNNGTTINRKIVAESTQFEIQCSGDGTHIFIVGYNRNNNAYICWYSSNSGSTFAQIESLVDQTIRLSEDGTTIIHHRGSHPINGSGHIYMRKAPFDTNSSTMIINDSLPENYRWNPASFNISPDAKVITAANNYSTSSSNMYISTDGGTNFIKITDPKGSVLAFNYNRGK